MARQSTPDLCVVGAGAGGLSVAAGAAALGASVALVEKAAMGGECLNSGCVPSKALIAAARAAQTMREAGRFGVRAHEPSLDYARVQARLREVIAAIAPNDSAARFGAMGVEVIRAPGRFVDARTLVAGDVEIRARRFIVATGSKPARPAIAGLDLVHWHTNETIFDLAMLPPRLIVVGAGAVGLELAQAFRRLGSDVTVLEAGRALGREDDEMVDPLRLRLRGEGVDLRENAAILRVEPRAGLGVRVVLPGHLLEETIDGSHLLIATGRAPTVEGLGLEAAGIAFDRQHGITVDAGMRTSNRRVYAIGDVAGPPQLTHAANAQAGVVLRSALFRLPARFAPHLIPRVTYTSPEVASVGLSEEQARAAHKKIRVLRWPFSENDRAVADGETRGHVKVVATASGRILGAAIVGAEAGEMIGLWAMAVKKKMTIRDMADVVLPYPTLSEASRRAALTGFARSLSNPWLGRALRFLGRFG
jgi:pyruvate/2-oxoglutarate dehydrogenase complex dihydrolipoamide dehydrogenase (E3) component